MLNDSKIKTYAAKTLAGMLGALDALFETRNYAWPLDIARDQACWQRQAQWLAEGLHYFRNPGGDPAERQSYVRALVELEKQGLIRTGPREHAGLTASGLEAARGLCRRRQLSDVIPGIDFMFSKTGTKHEWIDDPDSGWFSEATLAGFDPWPRGVIGKPRLPDSAYWVVDALCPLAIAGLTDHDFRPGFELPLYRLTVEGMKLAKSRKKSGEATPSNWLKLAARERPEPPPAYGDGWQAMDGFLQTAQPLKSNWVTHHLSANIFPRTTRLKA